MLCLLPLCFLVNDTHVESGCALAQQLTQNYYLDVYKLCNHFDYHLKQHYSQTRPCRQSLSPRFDYHLKQHYSQTVASSFTVLESFDYHLKQHYSQTSNEKTPQRSVVLFRWSRLYFISFRCADQDSVHINLHRTESLLRSPSGVQRHGFPTASGSSSDTAPFYTVAEVHWR